jgi:putative membrane protein
MDQPRSHLLAFLVRLVLSAGVLWLSVGWVSPENPRNTFGRAVLVSLLLALIYYVTLVKFLWFLIVPWLLYLGFWLAAIMGSYGLGFVDALLVALALAALSWVVEAAFGVKTFRSE